MPRVTSEQSVISTDSYYFTRAELLAHLPGLPRDTDAAADVEISMVTDSERPEEVLRVRVTTVDNRDAHDD